MSEAHPTHHEALPSPEHHELLEAHAKPEKHTSKAGEHEQAQHQLANEARHNISETATTQHNALNQLETNEEAPEAFTPRTISKDLKRQSLKRELRNVRQKLPAHERALSRFIHQPVVRVVSETAGKTISRPSGMLGGGLMAFVGSSGYLYLAKHLGFSYNYLVFLLLFAGGFLLGLVLELLVYMALTSRRQPQD